MSLYLVRLSHYKRPLSVWRIKWRGAPVAAQTKDDGGQEEGDGHGGGERWTGSKCVLEVDSTGLAKEYNLDLCESSLCPQLGLDGGVCGRSFLRVANIVHPHGPLGMDGFSCGVELGSQRKLRM